MATISMELVRARKAQKVFMLYVAYKRTCAAQCMQPVTYGAWLWMRGLSDQRPW